jgi:hypothetical protein
MIYLHLNADKVYHFFVGNKSDKDKKKHNFEQEEIIRKYGKRKRTLINDRKHRLYSRKLNNGN